MPMMLSLNLRVARLTDLARHLVPPVIWRWAFRTAVIKDIPHAAAYDPHYYPWLEPEFRARMKELEGRTAVKAEPVYNLTYFLRQSLTADGEVMECGVWKGGTAKVIRDELLKAGSNKKLHLFDSFAGMSKVNTERDRHVVGHFDDTSVEAVQHFVIGEIGADPAGICQFHPGWVPESFGGLEELRFCFAHIDLDLYQSIADALEFVYPRLTKGGIIVFDDYGFASCPGAKRAVDAFVAEKPEEVLVLHSGQAVLVKR